MTQVLAILSQSIRELRSRSLFWVSLFMGVGIAALVMISFRFTETGWGLFWFEVNESEAFVAGSNNARDAVRWAFAEVFVRWWVCWGAIALAVISTSSILPDFLTGGTIDMSLAKPISRLRLLWLKIIGALLFVFVQTAASIGLAYLLMGLRFGVWIHEGLWAVPLVLVQFVYLFAIATLVAVWTRSALASLLVTIVLWTLFSLLQFGANTIDEQYVGAQAQVETYDERSVNIRAMAEEEERDLYPAEEARLERIAERREEAMTPIRFIDDYLWPVGRLEFVIPKTADVQKIIASLVDAPSLVELMMRGEGGVGMEAMGDFSDDEIAAMEEGAVERADAARDVNVASSIASSMMLPVVCFALATLIFVRRDF